MAEILNSLCNELLLSQFINKPTHYQGNVLDLVLTNCMEVIHEYEIQPTILSISHHSMVNIFTQYKASQLPDDESSFPRLSPLDYYNFHSKDTNWENIQSSLDGLNWQEILKDKSTSGILEVIYEKTLETIKDNVPLREQKAKKLSKQKRIHMNLARRRRRVNKQYQRSTSQTRKDKLYKELIQIEVKIQKLQQQSEEYQEKKACESIKNNSKYFFSYAKKKRKVRSKVGPLLDKATNTMTTDSKKMANLLADQYSSVFSTPSTTPPPYINDAIETVSNITVSPEEVVDAIKELKPSSASGPDGFPAILLTKCCDQLAIPLSYLWGKSMDQSSIPQKLKFSIIPPIHKGGSKSIPANYRPVALTSHIIKIFEKII